MARAGEQSAWKSKYYNVISDLNKLQAENQKYEMARSMFIEYYFVAAEIIQYAAGFYDLANSSDEAKQEEMAKKLLEGVDGHFKNYQSSIDKDILYETTVIYAESVDPALLPDGFADGYKTIALDIIESSVLWESETVKPLLENWGKKSLKALKKDPAIAFANDLMMTFRTKVAGGYARFMEQEEKLMTTFVAGLIEMFPDKKIWSDANSTMRIAYGKIEGSAPHDGLEYKHYTTIDGIMQKHDPTNPDFVLTDRFVELYKEGDFGQYLQDGELWVCFTASNHTTGGNSGSPCIDADGNLIGINFDRSWESTMSDFMFDESRCRNIIVDIRYVLWVIDKYGEAPHLVEEMNIIK